LDCEEDAGKILDRERVIQIMSKESESDSRDGPPQRIIVLPPGMSFLESAEDQLLRNPHLAQFYNVRVPREHRRKKSAAPLNTVRNFILKTGGALWKSPFHPSVSDNEFRLLFADDGFLLLSLLKKFLLNALPTQCTLFQTLVSGSWEPVLNVLKFDSAVAPLLNRDCAEAADRVENFQTIRKVILQAHNSRQQNELPRFDCVVCVDRYSELPKQPFRAETLKFFQLPANDIVDENGIQVAGQEDLLFALVGMFRTVIHKPFNNYNHHFHDGRQCTRAALLGKTVVKLPANHITVQASNWQTQRFTVIALQDIKSTTHIIPLTSADGDPFLARFDPDDKMPPTLPTLAKEKQLHLFNSNIYV